MRPLKELNLSNVRIPPTEREVRTVENYFGFHLPPSYLEFLRSANGAHPEVDTFETEDEQWAVNNFFFLGADKDSTENLFWNLEHRPAELPPTFLPIARDGFGNMFLLNVKTVGQDEVWVWVHDDPAYPLVKLSDRFESFIDQLKLNPDYV